MINRYTKQKICLFCNWNANIFKPFVMFSFSKINDLFDDRIDRCWWKFETILTNLLNHQSSCETKYSPVLRFRNKYFLTFRIICVISINSSFVLLFDSEHQTKPSGHLMTSALSAANSDKTIDKIVSASDHISIGCNASDKK